jgi:hypothetical protein
MDWLNEPQIRASTAHICWLLYTDHHRKWDLCRPGYARNDVLRGPPHIRLRGHFGRETAGPIEGPISTHSGRCLLGQRERRVG